MATETAALAGLENATSPMPQPGHAMLLLSSSTGTAVTLTTDLSANVSNVVNVQECRRIALWIKYSVNAAGGFANLVPLISAEYKLPAIGDDDWYAPALLDATPTDAVLGGSLPTGADYTAFPEWRFVKAGGMVIRTIDGDNATDEIRLCVVLDVAHARWFYLAAEEGSGVAAGALLVKWSKAL